MENVAIMGEATAILRIVKTCNRCVGMSSSWSWYDLTEFLRLWDRPPLPRNDFATCRENMDYSNIEIGKHAIILSLVKVILAVGYTDLQRIATIENPSLSGLSARTWLPFTSQSSCGTCMIVFTAGSCR